METAVDGSSGSKEDDKPVIVRVKRKAFHSVLDAFLLEINERPLKRPLLDFENLAISESSGKVEELRTKRVLVKYVNTRGSSEATSELLQSFMPTCSEVSESKTRDEDRKSAFKRKNIHEEVLSKARETKQVLAENARFEQIWRRRRGNKSMKDDDKNLHEMYHFYDVVRIDEEEKSRQVPEEEEPVSLEDQRMLCSYLPLLREFIPNAADEIESDLTSRASKRGVTDDYVYDYYVVQDDVDVMQEDVSSVLPLVQVDEEEDFYDGPDTEYETDDSNAENNPLNDYPDESTDDEENNSDETNSDAKDDDDHGGGGGEEEEEEDRGGGEEEVERASNNSSREDLDLSFEDEDGFDFDGDEFGYADEEDTDTEDWRWSHR